MTASEVFQAPAATSWMVAKSMALLRSIFVLNLFVHLRPSMRASCQIVSHSSLLWMIIGAIGNFSCNKDNLKERRSCLIVLGRQHYGGKLLHCHWVVHYCSTLISKCDHGFLPINQFWVVQAFPFAMII